jgi:hypothetical protein
MYPTWADWLMLFLCAILVLPWLLGGLLVIKDYKERRKRNDSP